MDKIVTPKELPIILKFIFFYAAYPILMIFLLNCKFTAQQQ